MFLTCLGHKKTIIHVCLLLTACSFCRHSISAEAQKRELVARSVSNLAGGIKIPTISVTSEEDGAFQVFDAFRKYLVERYPRFMAEVKSEVVNGHGLLFKWKGKRDNLKPLLFLAHYDVVPARPLPSKKDNAPFSLTDLPAGPLQTTSQQWDFPPFSGAVSNGRIYGRGAIDMKSVLFALLEAATQLMEKGEQPEQDIWFAFGHDEEIGGTQGAVKIAEHLSSKGIYFSTVYDEGGIIVSAGEAFPFVKRPMALVGVAEKGMLTARVTVRGLGGHSSIPARNGALVQAAILIRKLDQNQYRPLLTPPVETLLKNIAPEAPWWMRWMLQVPSLNNPLLRKSLSGTPTSNALIRTTTALTMAQGSLAPNVLSSTAEFVVNFRLLPGDTVQEVLAHLEGLCKGHDVQIQVTSEREASKLSSSATPEFDRLRGIIQSVYPGTLVTPYLTIGGTDSYKYESIADQVYRFQPIELNQYEKQTIHSENEYLSIENYQRMIKFFAELFISHIK